MRLNLKQLAKTDVLMSKEIAEKVISEIKILDLEKYEISFSGVRLVSLNFLNPFIEYLDSALRDDANVKIINSTKLQNDLIIEAYKNCMANRRKVNEKL